VRSFHINAGEPDRWLRVAAVARAAARKYAPDWIPRFRPRYDVKSYLYNTDGYIVTNMGYPVVFLDEDINRVNMDEANPHYHQWSDRTRSVDPKYATDINKVAIATGWYLATE
jgi:hypothetical protein